MINTSNIYAFLTTKYGSKKQHPLVGSTQVHPATEWKAFYINVIDFLEALNFNTEVEDNTKWGWKQLKMMYEGEDWQAIQTLVDNATITINYQEAPGWILVITQTTIFLALQGWDSAWLYAEDRWRHTYTQQLHNYTSQQLHIFTQTDQLNA